MLQRLRMLEILVERLLFRITRLEEQVAQLQQQLNQRFTSQ